MPLDLQRKRDLGRILDDTFALYRTHWRTLLAVAVVVVVPVDLIVFGVGLGWLWEGYDAPKAGEVRITDVTDGLIGLVAQLLIVVPLVTAMTVDAVRAAGAGQTVATGDVLRAGLRALLPLVVVEIMVALGVTIGLFLLIVPGVILWVRWSVVPQIVVLEGQRGSAALQRSFALTRGQGWLTFLVVLVTNLLAGVFSQLVEVPLQYAAEQADSQAVLLLGQMLGLIITIPIVTVAMTLLYYSLLVPHGAQPQAVAPVPQTLPGVPGTFGDGFAPPVPPDSR